MTLQFRNFDKFFDENGYTSTSANYMANKAKEIIKSMMNKNISFVTKTAKTLGNGQDVVVNLGADANAINSMSQTLISQGELIALVSWLREAIKAKEYQINCLENMSFDEWMAIFHSDVDNTTYGVDEQMPDKPVRPNTNVSEYINENMSVKDVARYLFLLAQCSNIGDFIHPDGKFATARDYAIEHDGLSNIKDYNANTVVFTENMSVDVETIDKAYFDLQEKHRAYQKELNAIKYDVEHAIQKMLADYETALAQWQIECDTINTKRNNAYNKFKAEYVKWRNDELEKIRAKKIVIPNDFKHIVELVNNFKRN